MMLVIIISFLFSLKIVVSHAWEGTDPLSVRDYIAYVARNEGVEPKFAQAIAKAESNFVHNAKNPLSSASGVFQFVNGTFKAYCIDKYSLTDTMADKNNPFIQTNCAIYMLKEANGYKHWLASYAGWQFAHR